MKKQTLIEQSLETLKITVLNILKKRSIVNLFSEAQSLRIR